MDTSKVTRLTVIDHTESGLGTIVERWSIKVELALQDDGRTLKVWMRDRETKSLLSKDR